MKNKTIRKLNRDGTVGEYTLEQYKQLVEAFHGFFAPGLVLGGFMVDFALKHLPQGELFDAVSETKSCLPDAIQILTPCTAGNNWLKIMDFSRFAICFYEKNSGCGTSW